MQRRNPEQCQEMLKFLDYLRKSQCTQTTGFLRDGAQPIKNSECTKTLNLMEEVAKECLESSGFKLK